MTKIRINAAFKTPLIVLLDDEDVHRVKQYTWILSGPGRSIQTDFNYRTISLGRFLLNYEGPLTVDHKDRDILNNQKYNLRLATNEQQQHNTGPRLGKKYKGVYIRKYNGTFSTEIQVGKERKYFGKFATEEEAARKYDELAKEYHGEFAYLNFPEESK